MIPDTDYKMVSGLETHGSYGEIGIKILVAVKRQLSDAEKNHIYRCVHGIEQEIIAGTIAADPEAMRAARDERSTLLGLFPYPIYVEEIPNGYCSSGCCRHRPWFVVTTPVGRIKIGWRKRVINIDWSESDVKTSAQDLFPREDVTKFERYIHAWGYEKAREYVHTILAANQPETL
jgi:hypothetical protein